VNKVYFCGGADKKMTFIDSETFLIIIQLEFKGNVNVVGYCKKLDKFFCAGDFKKLTLIDALTYKIFKECIFKVNVCCAGYREDENLF